MTEPNGQTGELAAEEQELAARLAEERPVPRAGFRGALGRHLASRDPGYGPRPERLRLMVAGYAGAGTCLIAVGALIATRVL
jgi:hypothetical protein